MPILVAVSCKPEHKEKEGVIVKTPNYELFVKDYGKGNPTVIIENGLACTTGLYDDLQQRLAKFTRVISYDHAGIGKSSPSSNPRTLPFYVEELRELLNTMNIKPPYIFVGHSLGGHIIRYYTYLYPEEVAGLVFIDHPHENWFSYVRTHLSPENLDKFNSFFDPKRSKYTGVELDELTEYEPNCDSIRGKIIPSNISVRMYTGTAVSDWAIGFGYNKEDMKVWAEMQDSLLIGVKDAKHITDEKEDHFFHLHQPQLIAKGVYEIFETYNSNHGKN